MKRLLATTAIATSMAFAGTAAFADDPDPQASLLSQILADVNEVQLSMFNTAENLATLDGSINIDSDVPSVNNLLASLTASTSFGGEQLFSADVTIGSDVFTVTGTEAELNEILDAANLGTDQTFTAVDENGNEVLINPGQDGVSEISDFALAGGTSTDLIEGILRGVSRATDGTTAVDFFEPAATVAALQTDISDLQTTVIGALNTGVIGGQDENGNVTANVLNLANNTTESVAQTTNNLASSLDVESFNGMQFANQALNAADNLNGSVNITQLMASIDDVQTTVIGALNTGDIATNIDTRATGITEAIVGN